MALGALARSEVVDQIEGLADSRELTIVVGAGASVEATLPSWGGLVDQLLSRTAQALGYLELADQARWIEETKLKDSLLGAGAVVEALSGGQLNTWLLEELFQGRGAGGFEPGPISKQVAALQVDASQETTVITTNYDDLLERALQYYGVAQSKIKSYVRTKTPPAGSLAVTHLHGFAGRRATNGPLILSEEHYHAMQRGSSWQERLMLDRLRESDCLFIGTSLSDPNLIRYLYGASAPTARHRVVVFIRQEDELEPAVRRAREQAVAERWRRCGVDAIFLDHYSDAAQFLYEVRYRRWCGQHSETYETVVDRADTWLSDVHRSKLGLHREPQFLARQDWWSSRLSAILERALRFSRRLGYRRAAGETLQLVMWLADPRGKTLTGWAHSDRAHRDRRTVEPVLVDAASNWVAVRAFCQGTTMERDRDVYASRWKYVRGIPLILDQPTRVPIGCLSVASTAPGRSSVLKRMSPDARSEFNDFIRDSVLELLSSS